MEKKTSMAHKVAPSKPKAHHYHCNLASPGRLIASSGQHIGVKEDVIRAGGGSCTGLEMSSGSSSLQGCGEEIKKITGERESQWQVYSVVCRQSMTSLTLHTHSPCTSLLQ